MQSCAMTMKKTNSKKLLHSVLSAAALVGNKVRNSVGEELGKIGQITIDISSGSIAYVVLCFSGSLGMGSKFFAVPWDALRFAEQEQCFILDVASRALEFSPGSDGENWSGTTDAIWGSDGLDYDRSTPY